MRYKNSLREFLIYLPSLVNFEKLPAAIFLPQLSAEGGDHSLGSRYARPETTLLYSPAMASASTISASADFAADSIDAQVVAYEVVVLPTAARRSLFAESPKL